MAVEVRRLTKEDEPELRDLWSQAFEYGKRFHELPEWAQYLPEVTHCGIRDERGLQANVTIHHYRALLGADVVAPMGGIAGVATAPASRGRGYAGAGLRYALEVMRETGEFISTLFPFSWEYYRRFGWEWVGVERRYVLPAGVLKVVPETERVRPATEDDRTAIDAAYSRHARRYRGALVRDENLWGAILNHRRDWFTSTYVYGGEGGVEGYLTFRGGKEERTDLREFVALTPEARSGLLGLLKRMEMQARSWAWSAPEDDPLWTSLCHWDVETRIKPVTQGRVVDVPAALEAWTPSLESSGAVTLAVTDDCAPWNARTWRAEYADGEVRVSPTSSEPQVSLDIQALSQAYFGTPSLGELRVAGRLSVHDEAGYVELEGLLRGPRMWMNDHF
jgi:predicted acetyltransferase